MLKQRILTALVLAGLFLPALFLLPRTGFAVLIGLLVLLTAREWAGLAGLRGVARLLFAAVVTAVGAALLMADGTRGWVLGGGALLWGVLSLRLLFAERAPEWVHAPLFKLSLAPLVLWPAWFALDALHTVPQGAWWALAPFMLVWVADSAAYFAGRAFGRRKLAPSISPGKTVEGVLGALVAVALAGWAAHQFPPYALMPLFPWLGLLLVTTLISVMGDLHESQLKREAGVKDSGTLLPGHGGLFDRVDSLLAAAPVMAFGLMLLGLFKG
ncbi:MAG: phosphatidate cytidylyltransferase [Pseudomonadota bacterium]